MNENPIFDALLAEFTERSKYCRLMVGPPVGQGFVADNGIKIGFEIVNGVTRIMEYGPVVGEGFEVVDGVTRMIEAEESPKPKLYIVEGAPELIDLAKMAPAEEESEMEKTIVIPRFVSDMPEPPSTKPALMAMLEDTQAIPVIKDDQTDELTFTEVFSDPTLVDSKGKTFVTPIKRVKARTHKKNGATGTLSWFTNSHRAA